MENIIQKIQSGELSQVQLIETLVAYENQNVDDYNAIVDEAEANDRECEKLRVEAAKREDDIRVIADQGLHAVDYAKKLEDHIRKLDAEVIRLKSEVKEIKQLRNENKSLKKLKAH